MHMADALLSPAVGLAMCAVSAVAIARSISKVKKDDSCDRKIPLIAVAGAFVFAAQMINFTIPGTGSSGHIGGGILLAAMLGAPSALIALSAVLVIQAFFFADGGILALGANIFNMGVLPCLIAYPLLFKPFVKAGLSSRRITAASILSVTAGLQLGAFSVVLETLASGITELPFFTFLILMQPIHLAIGLVEGVATAAILNYVAKERPEILAPSGSRANSAPFAMKRALAVFAAAAIILGGGLSLFASSYPDGLEWSMEKAAGTAELTSSGAVAEAAAKLQEKTAFMPNYSFAGTGGGTSAAGVAGSLFTFALAGGAAFLISRKGGRGA